MAASVNNVLNYEGSNFLRQRLILSIISGKTVKIKNIRSTDENPGLKEFEANLLKLLEQLSKGSSLQVSPSGTKMVYVPGMLDGGKVEHDCNLTRSIGYYLEVLVCLAPFMRTPLRAVLTGVTNDTRDPSVDMVKSSLLPVVKRFVGTDEGLEIKINKRGAAPLGGGEVLFTCPARDKVRPIQCVDSGKIRRFRGIAWAVRVAPSHCNRMVDAARKILNQMLPDVYIYTDHCTGARSGNSPGFGMTLVAETTNGVFYAAEFCSNPKGSPDGPTCPEDVGEKAARLLIEEIYTGGCVDTLSQSFAVLMMTLGDKDVSKLQIGFPTPYTQQMCRHIRDFLGVRFKIDAEDEPDEELATGDQKYVFKCAGVGYRNLSKPLG